MKTIDFKSVSFGYSSKNCFLTNINIQLKNKNKAGYVIAIMGASGSGKTTLLKLISQSLTPIKGEITIAPKNPRVSYLPQSPVLFNHLSPIENIRYFEKISSHKDHFDSKYTDQLMIKLGINEIAKKTKTIEELSGGQKQRIALARSLSINPDILLLDEPTKGLNGNLKKEFLLQLLSLVREKDILVFYVTHQVLEAKIIADEIVYLDKKHKDQVSLTKMNTKDFFNSPPSLDIVKEIKFPFANILFCKIIDNQFFLADKNDENGFFVVVEKTNIVLDKFNGWPFCQKSINVRTQEFLLENGQTLLFEEINSDEYSKVKLTGQITTYNKAGVFNKKMKVTNNFIDNE